MAFAAQPPPVRFSTRDAPRGMVTDYWSATLDNLLPLTYSDFAERFQARCEARAIGGVLGVDIHSERVHVRRAPADVARRETGACYVFEQLDRSGSAFRAARGAETFVEAGDLFLGDADTYLESLTETRFGHRFWLIPRTFVSAWGAGGALEHGVHLRRDAPFARLLLGYLSQLREVGTALDPIEAEVAADIVGRLISAAAGARGADGPLSEAVARGELALVKRQVAAHLTDPLLSPTRIASKCAMSVRKLHALFEPTGVTFTAYVTGLRLDLARRALRDPARTHEPIAEVAYSVGFNSLSAFYRAYGLAFGEAPGDTRAR